MYQKAKLRKGIEKWEKWKRNGGGRESGKRRKGKRGGEGGERGKGMSGGEGKGSGREGKGWRRKEATYPMVRIHWKAEGRMGETVRSGRNEKVEGRESGREGKVGGKNREVKGS